MGSQQSNDNFNEKMDMNEHRNKMATMNNQYRSHDLDFR